MSADPSNPWYWSVRAVVRCFIKLYFRLEVRGAEHVPLKGGCILTPNHASFLDPPIVGSGVSKRVVHFMARDNLFDAPVLGWWYRKIGTIAIDRTKGDLAALRSAIQYLKSGNVVCLFPEGTRSLDGAIQEAKGGVGFLIAKSGVPVVPVYLDGTYRAWPKGSIWIKPAKIRVTFGQAIRPEELQIMRNGKTDYDLIVKKVMSSIAALKPAD